MIPLKSQPPQEQLENMAVAVCLKNRGPKIYSDYPSETKHFQWHPQVSKKHMENSSEN